MTIALRKLTKRFGSLTAVDAIDPKAGPAAGGTAITDSESWLGRTGVVCMIDFRTDWGARDSQMMIAGIVPAFSHCRPAGRHSP